MVPWIEVERGVTLHPPGGGGGGEVTTRLAAELWLRLPLVPVMVRE